VSERRNPRSAAVSEWPAPFGQRSALSIPLSIPLSVPPHTPRTEDGRLARIVQAQHEDARLPIPKQGEQARHPETHCACRFFALGLCAELSLSLSLCLSLSPGGGGYAGGEGGCVRRMCAGRRRMGHSTRLVLTKSAVKTDKKNDGAAPVSHSRSVFVPHAQPWRRPPSPASWPSCPSSRRGRCAHRERHMRAARALAHA